jgi:hypothetical protein
MQILGLLGFGALVVASFAVGFRLLRLASRTGRLPERMIGGAFVFAGGLPGVLLFLGDDGSGSGPTAQGWMLAPIANQQSLGIACLWIGVAFRIAAYAWAVAEAARAWLAARRRCAIGLTDPLTANRMLLWAIGLGAVLAIWLHEAATLALGGGPGSYLVIAVLGFVCAGALWLAFFPPAFYQRRFAAVTAA